MADASNEWMGQFNCGGGSTVLDCVCGKTHVAIDSNDLSDEERVSYSTREGPRLVLHYRVDSVTEHTFAGMTIVDDCDCGRMAMIERMVSRERNFILGYFRALASKAERDAAELRAGLDGDGLAATSGGQG